MSELIYVIVAESGDYSDRTAWPVCWCRDEEQAKAQLAKLEGPAALYREMNERHRVEFWAAQGAETSTRKLDDGRLVCAGDVLREMGAPIPDVSAVRARHDAEIRALRASAPLADFSDASYTIWIVEGSA